MEDYVVLDKVRTKGRVSGFAPAARRRARAVAMEMGTSRGRRNFLVTLARSIENGHSAAAGSPVPEGAVKNVASESAAAGAAKSAAKKSFASGWWKKIDEGGRKLAESVGSGIAKKASELKGPAMEMKVNVDVLKPTIDGFKTSVGEFWVKVPPPVRKASPYIGVAMVTALTIHSIESKLRHKSEKKLALKLAMLEEEKIAIADKMKELESNRYMRGDSTVDMSRAVSEATAAAASAAAAAAEAARYCIVRR